MACSGVVVGTWAELDAAHASTGGHTVLRRLNRREYINTVGDLLGINMLMFDPTSRFPRDQMVDHMDNIGDALALSLVTLFLWRAIRFGRARDFILAGLLLGFAFYFYRLVFGEPSQPPNVVPFQPVAIPILRDIPVLGPILFNQFALSYLAFLGVAIAGFFLRRGLRHRHAPGGHLLHPRPRYAPDRSGSVTTQLRGASGGRARPRLG